MGKKYLGEVQYPAGYSVQTNKPLDDRIVVDLLSDLEGDFATTYGSLAYQGMIVAVVGDSTSNNGAYVLTNDVSGGAAPVWVKMKLATDPEATQLVADDTEINVIDDGLTSGTIQFTVDGDQVFAANQNELVGSRGGDGTRSTLGRVSFI